MKPHLSRPVVASPPMVPARPDANRLVLLGVGFLCFGLAITGCNKDETVQSNESGTSVDFRSKSETAKEHSPESVKDLFLSEQRQRETLAEMRRQAIEELSASALVTSIRSLDLLGDANDRVILPELFLALGKKSPGSVLEMLDELPGEYYSTAISEAFPYLAKENPEILQNYVLTGEFVERKERRMMLGACEVLGKENPAKALGFFDEMSDEKKQGPLGTTLLQQAASKEPALVVDFLGKKRDAPYFIGLFRDVLYRVLLNDPAFAHKLTTAYPEVRDTNLSAGIYASMARKDPKWALEEMPNASAEVREEILTRHNFDNESYFSKLFSADPARTIKLLHGITPNTTNSKLYEEAAKGLSSLPAGPVRESSVRSFAEAIRPADPETADRWIESLR